MKKVMLCVPIINKTEEEIAESVKRAKESFLTREDVTSDVEFVCDYPVPDDSVIDKGLYYTSVIIRAISMSNTIYFSEDWKLSNESYSIHTYAATLGIDMLHEEKTDLFYDGIGGSLGLLSTAFACGLGNSFTTNQCCAGGKTENE